jgi:hypothetical protein
MTLRVALKQRGLSFHHQRSGPHTYMIQMFGNLVMIWLQICSTPSRMTCHSILKVIFSHPLVHTLLRMQICFMRTSNHSAQILRNTRTWPPQSSQRFILQSGSIFTLEISMEIHKGRGDVFLHLRLFLTSHPLLQRTMQYSSDLSFPLCPRQVVSLYARMKMSLRLHMVASFRYGLINLVATLSGGMIGLMVSLSSRNSSLPPIFMSFIS